MPIALLLEDPEGPLDVLLELGSHKSFWTAPGESVNEVHATLDPRQCVLTSHRRSAEKRLRSPSRVIQEFVRTDRAAS
jgi:hypothetical protein